MSTIDEIFATISEEDVSANIDELLVIDQTTRQISLPSSELIFGVENDGRSERKYFQCPRVVGNDIDITSCFIRINYRNANGEVDSHLVEDVTVSGDAVLFSWELHEKVTKYKGNVQFLVCAYRADKVEWHTTLATGLVLEGLEPDVDGAVAETGDLVAQLLTMVASQTESVKAEGATQIAAVKASAKATEAEILNEIEAKGTNTLASIPNDYTALGEAVGALERMAAPGIVCEAEGTSIVVADASNSPVQNLRIFGRSTQDGTPTPDNPVEIQSVTNPVVTVCGKNLFHLGTFSGTQSSWNEVSFPAGEYTFSAIATSNDTDSTTCLVLVYEDRQKLVEKRFSRGVRESLTFTVTGTLTHIILYASNTNNNSAGDTFEFADTMLEVNSEATAYDPYKTPQTLPITHTLHGIPVSSGGNYTDSNGQQWICDEVDLERGVYVQRVYSGQPRFDSATVTQPSGGYTEGRVYANTRLMLNGLSDCFVYSQGGLAKERFAVLSDGAMYFTIKGEYSESEWRAKMNDISPKVLAPLVTPIETPLTEAELASFKALHTNKPHTTVLNDQSAHAEISYVADTKLYIDRKIESILG